MVLLTNKSEAACARFPRRFEVCKGSLHISILSNPLKTLILHTPASAQRTCIDRALPMHQEVTSCINARSMMHQRRRNSSLKRPSNKGMKQRKLLGSRARTAERASVIISYHQPYGKRLEENARTRTSQGAQPSYPSGLPDTTITTEQTNQILT